MTDFRVIIPARYSSSRLPGKPLRDIAGRPMVAHVWDHAVASGAAETWVATDDERIVRAVEEHGGRAILTSAEHESGTDRLAEVARDWPDDTIVVNLQGDEPGVGPELIQLVANALATNPAAGVATLATPIDSPQELFDPNAVKVVLDDAGMALYFSRAPIPWVRGVFTPGSLQLGCEGLRERTFLRHLGLYAYRAGTLRRLAAEPPNAHEQAEALEQLRALGLGVGIVVSVIDEAPLHGVDTEEDLRRVVGALAQQVPMEAAGP